MPPVPPFPPSLEPPIGLHPPRDGLPGYEITERIHAGARAVLYRAHRIDDGARVLLKTPHATRPTARDVADFDHEYTVLDRLSGTAVATAIALEHVEGRPWLVLEDLGGAPLDSIASRFRAPAHAIAIGAKIAAALAQIHLRGVIHRDIKPAHVLVLENGSVRLTGFRIASLLRVDASPVSVQGTFAYMAPEQTGRMNRPVDQRADLYALGVTLYALLTGRLPFEATDPLELVHAHIAKSAAAPETLDERVPGSVSALVLKLLAKHPEDRYYGASAVARDLVRCNEYLQQGRTEPFPLATDDAPEDFRISRRLYGREREVAQLLAGFERARTGPSCVVSLVRGYSGIGKTSVVGSLYHPIVRNRGRFVSGKFDQYKRDIPYATIVQAFRDLMRAILSEGEASLESWRAQLVDALGSNGQVIVDVIPDLELVIGAQSSVLELDPQEAQNRFESTLLAFVRVFARADHPLVLFLDDLQWADGATLGVLKLLAFPGAIPALQVVLAYRDNEVADTHPLQRCIDAMHASGAVSDDISVGDLASADVLRLVADTVARAPDETEVSALSQLVGTKAGGNPFFINALLHALDTRGLFTFDRSLRGWTWNAPALRAVDVADNVVDLLVERLRNLPEVTQRALELASCFGSRFRLGTMAAVLEIAAEDAFRALLPALEESLIVNVDDEIGADRTYRFHHDRIQQAAYSLVTNDERAKFHLRIGRLLRDSLGDQDDLLFDVVKHLDQAGTLITEPSERQHLIELNLSASRRAKASIAWEPARLYLESATALMSPDAWTAHHATTFDVLRELAQCEFLTGHFERAEQHFDELRERATSAAHRADIATLQVKLYILTGRYDQALTLGLSELALLGEPFPATAAEDEEIARAIDEERRRIAAQLGDRDVRTILELPSISNPEKRAAITLLASLPPAIYSRRPAVFPILAMKMVNLSLEYGNCEGSVFGYSMYAMILAAAEGNTERGYALSEASIALNARLRDPRLLGTVLHVHANHIVFWKRPYADAIGMLDRAYTACVDVGDLTIAAYVLFMGSWMSIESAQAVAVTTERVARYEALIHGTRHATARDAVQLQRQFLRALAGETLDPVGLSTSDFDADAARQRIATAGLDTALAMHDLLRAILAWHHGRHADADGWLARAATTLPAAFCLPLETTWFLFDALTAAGRWDDAPEADKPALYARVARAEQRFAGWASGCADNFEARHALIAAEAARLNGGVLDALRGYERAALAARRYGLLWIEAIACQLAARMYLASGLPAASETWRHRQYEAFRQWGATSLLRDLPAVPDAVGTLASEDTSRVEPDRLDLASALKVSHALSRELTVEALTRSLLRILLENAGAQRAILLLTRGGQLEIAGHAGADQETDATGTTELPASIIRYVERTRTPIVLANALDDATFGADDYLLRARSKSVLCIPVIVRGNLAGLVYLENALVAGAFSQDRLALLDVIATQLAISLENLRLHKDREDQAAESARSETLAWSDRRYREAIESMGDAFCVLDRDWRFVAVNKNHERLTQRPRETTLGTDMWEQFPAATDPDRKYWRELHRVMEDRVEAHFVEYYEPLDVWTELDVIPAINGGIAIFTRDITERKRLERESEQLYTRELEARQLAESAGRAKDEFLAMLGHELRNPLAPILTALELMSLRGTNESERERQIIGRQVDHMVRLVDDLLDVSRVTRGRIELSRHPIEIGELVARGIELVAPLLESAHHEISVHVPRRGLVVNADANRLAQVFSNLLTNAAKYTPARGRITITATREESDVMVSIRDTGVGIPSDLLPRVFDLFVQNSQTLDRSRGGLGIGLAIVQSLVQLHGGSVSAQSDGAGTGSTFTVRIPMATEVPVETERAPAPPAVAPALKDRNVLIVDDNDDAAELLAESLQRLGYTTRTAHDGPAALAVLQTFRPDLALLDIGLPGMDGYELARQLRQIPAVAAMRLVAITGYGQESDRQRAHDAGFDAHLVKPVSLAKLRAVLDDST